MLEVFFCEWKVYTYVKVNSLLYVDLEICAFIKLILIFSLLLISAGTDRKWW